MSSKCDDESGSSTDIVLSPQEKKDMSFFIAGLMFFKFAYESMNTCIQLFILTRFSVSIAVTMLTVCQFLFAIAQSCSGILCGSLQAHILPSKIKGVAMFIFGLISALVMIIEAATDGNWSPGIILPLYFAMGLCLGMMEVVRRTIARQIMGTDVEKLKYMDASVHIWYEVAGTSGAFASTPIVLGLGYVYGLILLPLCFTLGSICYFQVSPGYIIIVPVKPNSRALETEPSLWAKIVHLTHNYFQSLRLGFRTVVFNRDFSWLLLGYVIPLVMHRVIEGVFVPVYCKFILKDGSLSGLMVGGSNFGELVGAFCVLLFSRQIKLPHTWIRLDACMLLLLWIMPHATPTGDLQGFKMALALIPMMFFVSASWAAGDCSLLAYLQSQLEDDADEEDQVNVQEVPVTTPGGVLNVTLDREHHTTTTDREVVTASQAPADGSELTVVVSDENVSSNTSDAGSDHHGQSRHASAASLGGQGQTSDTPIKSKEEKASLGVVMGFLYSCYAAFNVVIGLGIGRLIDYFNNQKQPAVGLFYSAGVLTTCVAVLIFASTFVSVVDIYAQPPSKASENQSDVALEAN